VKYVFVSMEAMDFVENTFSHLYKAPHFVEKTGFVVQKGGPAPPMKISQ